MLPKLEVLWRAPLPGVSLHPLRYGLLRATPLCLYQARLLREFGLVRAPAKQTKLPAHLVATASYSGSRLEPGCHSCSIVALSEHIDYPYS